SCNSQRRLVFFTAELCFFSVPGTRYSPSLLLHHALHHERNRHLSSADQLHTSRKDVVVFLIPRQSGCLRLSWDGHAQDCRMLTRRCLAAQRYQLLKFKFCAWVWIRRAWNK